MVSQVAYELMPPVGEYVRVKVVDSKSTGRAVPFSKWLILEESGERLSKFLFGVDCRLCRAAVDAVQRRRENAVFCKRHIGHRLS